MVSFDAEEICGQFTLGLRKYAKKICAFVIKVDPFVINENYPDQPHLSFGNSFHQTLNCMSKCGFRHNGFGNDVNAYFQPRVHLAIPLFDEKGRIKTEDFLNRMPRKTRYYMDSFQSSKGLEFVRADSDDDLTKFIYNMQKTEERKSIALRNLDYFKTIKDSFGDRAVFYYGRIHMDKYTAYLQGMIDKDQNAVENQKKLNEALQLQVKGNTVYLCASLVIFPKENDQMKIAEYIYAGSDLSILPALNASVGMIYTAVSDAIQAGCQYFNLGGTDGSLEDSLSRFKLKFNPLVWEFVGEFDLVIRPLIYYTFDRILPHVRRIITRR